MPTVRPSGTAGPSQGRAKNPLSGAPEPQVALWCPRFLLGTPLVRVFALRILMILIVSWFRMLMPTILQGGCHRALSAPKRVYLPLILRLHRFASQWEPLRFRPVPLLRQYAGWWWTP